MMHGTFLTQQETKRHQTDTNLSAVSDIRKFKTKSVTKESETCILFRTALRTTNLVFKTLRQ